MVQGTVTWRTVTVLLPFTKNRLTFDCLIAYRDGPDIRLIQKPDTGCPIGCICGIIFQLAGYPAIFSTGIRPYIRQAKSYIRILDI
jgi:hypothetical protein